MSGRVLSTPEAKAAIVKMQQIINGGLIEQIEALNREGTTLSDANIWDGRLAGEFREVWRQTNATLRDAKQQLDELRANIQTINQNIMSAGGNE